MASGVQIQVIRLRSSTFAHLAILLFMFACLFRQSIESSPGWPYSLMQHRMALNLLPNALAS